MLADDAPLEDPQVGDVVVLAPGYADVDDAGHASAPLRPGVEGVVERVNGPRSVRVRNPADSRTWNYNVRALLLVGNPTAAAARASRGAGGSGGRGGRGGGPDLSVLSSTAKRGAWEKLLDLKHLSRVLNAAAVGDVIAKGAQRFRLRGAEGGDEGGVFQSELQEGFDPQAMLPTERAKTALNLFRYRRPFSLAHFTTALKRVSNESAAAAEAAATAAAANATAADGAGEAAAAAAAGGGGAAPAVAASAGAAGGAAAGASPFPALEHFLEHEPILRALRHMPAAFKWIRLLLQRFNRRMERETARRTTIAEVLSQAPPHERGAWEEAYEGFAAAWNLGWKHVTMIECREVKKDFPEFVGMTMARDVPVSFCMPCREDEGLCCHGLMVFLKDAHNALIFSVDERMLMLGGKGGARSEAHADKRARVVSSRHMTDAHTVRYDLEEELIPFFAKQCMTVAGASYDFGKAEARLLDRYLSRVPVVDFEQRSFTFSHEQNLQGGLEPLKAKVRQEPLAHDVKEAIQRDLNGSAARAQRILEQLEMVVSFLTATGGSFVEQLDTSVGELQLSYYVLNFLRDDEAALDLGRAVTNNVRLKHIESLWGILDDVTLLGVDPFAKTDKKYKMPLSGGGDSDGGDGDGGGGSSLSAASSASSSLSSSLSSSGN